VINLTLLKIFTPPLPHFITVYDDIFPVGQTHASRKAIGVFDLIVVTEGCLHIAEESEEWEVSGGHAIILRPDKKHSGTKPCSEETRYFWLHFNTDQEWTEVPADTQPECGRIKNHFTPIRFSILLPRFFKLSSPALIYEQLRQLQALEGHPLAKSRWKQQLIFQEMLLELSQGHPVLLDPSTVQLAEGVAAYISDHYRNAISYQTLGEMFNFHPAYIARCFKRVFDCTPLEHLISFRILQGKIILMNSDKPIGRITEDVGFSNVSYFIRCFTKAAGVTPLQYRKLYRV
jgi:AraC-like DNA-binding protein